jgi:hypothetical protein
MFDPSVREEVNACYQLVGAADSRTIQVLARVDAPSFSMSAIRSALSQWKDVRTRCAEHWSDRYTQIASTDETKLHALQDERCEYLSGEASEDEEADASPPDSQSLGASKTLPGSAWQQLREECSERWQSRFDQTHAETLKRREQTALKRCRAAIDEAWSAKVPENAGTRGVDRSIALWNHARAICPMIWSSSDEQSYQTAIAELQRRREASKVMEDARERERQRCGGGEITGFVMLMRVGNLDASKAVGCTLDVYVVRIVNNTRDGWVIVEPAAAIRSQPLPNGSVMQNKRVRFLGMKAFTMVDGTVNAIPTFALIE